MEKPYSPSCDRNKEPILEALKTYLDQGRLLEVGSGTGQHAVYFASHLPEVEWVTSDLAENHDGIEMWLQEAGLKNTKGPLLFEIGKHEMPSGHYDYIFTANSLHIMPWEKVETFIQLLEKQKGSQVFFYGPFNYGGQYSSASNEEFDQWLKDRSPYSGIRDFEKVSELMGESGYSLLKDHEMPANNRLLVFE